MIVSEQEEVTQERAYHLFIQLFFVDPLVKLNESSSPPLLTEERIVQMLLSLFLE
jgi:hypothetical protein